MTQEKVLAWHFLHANGTLQYGDGRKPIVERRLRTKNDQPLALCHNGMHGSEDILDALRYAPGPIVCRVELSGEILRSEDKLCARYRKVIAKADVSKELRLFAVWCAERAMKQLGWTDERSWNAVRVAKRFAHGKATAEELSAAAAHAAAASADAAYAASAAAAASATAERKRQSTKLTKTILKLLNL